MAKKNTTVVLPKAELTISKEEFCQLLTRQIENGKELLKIQVRNLGFTRPSGFVYPSTAMKVEYDNEEFEEFKDKKMKWENYCLEMLKQSFNIPNNEYYKDFENEMSYDAIWGTSDRLADYKKEIQKKIQNLESLRERVDLIPTVVQENHSELQDTNTSKASMVNEKNIFVVYGHDERMKLEIENFLSVKLKLHPISLDTQPNGGQTIIEKFEEYAKDVNFAVILLTADDKIGGTETFRARQNVVFEMGYFMGALGRDHVMCLVQENVETPGDIDGVVYTNIDKNGIWKYSLVKELKTCGYDVDANKVL
jgi:predicted nucleotide-binding protein